MRKLLVAGLLLVLACLHAASGAAAPGNEAARAAAVLKAYGEQVRRTFDGCAATYRGRGGEYFAFMQSLWVVHHEALSALTVEGAGDAAVRLSADALPASVRASSAGSVIPASCGALEKDMLSHALDFERAFPAEAASLQAVLAARSDPRIVQRNADLTIGCMKKLWNSGGRDAPAASRMCHCNTGVILRSATDEEVDAFLALVASARGNTQEVVEKTPWLRRAQPEMAACLGAGK